MTYGYQNGYNPQQSQFGYGNQQQQFGQQQSFGYNQAPVAQQQPPLRTIAPQGTAHLLPNIDAALTHVFNEWLVNGTPQRKAFAQVALAFSKANPKFNSLVFDIAEWMDMTARQNNQFPDPNSVPDRARHFATIAACASTLDNHMTNGLDQQALDAVNRAAAEYRWIVQQLDQQYNQNAQPMMQGQAYGQSQYQGASMNQAMGVMSNTQQQPLFVNPNPAQGYNQPQVQQQNYGYNPAPVQGGHISQYMPQQTVTASGGRYLDLDDVVVVDPNGTVPAAQAAPTPAPVREEVVMQQPTYTQQQPTYTPEPQYNEVNGGVANFIETIDISPTTYEHTNHTEVRDNTRMQATNRLILNLQINRHQIIQRRKKISTAYNINTTVALLEESADGQWDEMFTPNDTESIDKLKLRGINVEYVDFETEKLIHPQTQLDIDRVPDTGLAFKTMEAAAVSMSVEDLLKDMENEGGVADGNMIDLPEAVRLDKALALMETADVYSEVAVAMADLNIDIGSTVHAVSAPTVRVAPFSSTQLDWIEKINKAQSSKEVIALLEEAREWMGEYHWNKLHTKLTDVTNFLLRTEFENRYTIDSYELDTVALFQLVKEKCTEAEIETFKRIGKRTIQMAFQAFSKEQMDALCGAEGHATPTETFVLGEYVPTVILPVYGADLGIAFAGDLGIVTKTRMPQLFDLIQSELSKVDSSIPVYRMDIITKDAHTIKVYINLDGERVILR